METGGRFKPDHYVGALGCSYAVRRQSFSANTQRVGEGFLCREKTDNSPIKEIQTHYFDEKQLVCCQLVTEFTLLVKFAAGHDVSFIRVCLKRWRVLTENWLQRPAPCPF